MLIVVAQISGNVHRLRLKRNTVLKDGSASVFRCIGKSALDTKLNVDRVYILETLEAAGRRSMNQGKYKLNTNFLENSRLTKPGFLHDNK
jgi:hypothetical protein